jgi:rhomboid protease GluP
MLSEQPSAVLGASTTDMMMSNPTRSADDDNDTGFLSGIMTSLSEAQTSFLATSEDMTSVGRSRASSVPFNVTSASTHTDAHHQRDGLLLWNDSQEYYHTKQKYAYCSLIITGFQVLVLMMQLALCGVAPLDVNPMVGPYPDAFSEWGGKNAYWIQQGMQLWRFVSPALLHVGVLHLLCNAVVQLETCAFFEREWGSVRWLCVYVLSEVGCIATSVVTNPDTIAVGSSGALMGLFGAKLAQVFSHTCFEVYHRPNEESIRLEHLSNVLCSLAIVSVLSFPAYIDFSGHMGGLATGFFSGMFFFCIKIRNICVRVPWAMLGVGVTFGGLGFCLYWFWTQVETDAEMANACEYFRNLFVEDYDCDCFWE